jgi:uncharacterized protein DUF4136
MNRARNRIFLGFSTLLAVLVAAGCQSVTTHFDRGTDFASLKTYRWDEGTPPSGPFAVMNDFVQKTITEELAARGLQVDSQKAALLARYHTDTDQAFTLNANGDWSAFFDLREVRFQQGTLVLDLIDARTKKLLWRGTAEDVFDQRDLISQNEKRVALAVKKMLADFPPEKS